MRIYITGHRGRLGSELIRQGCLPLCDDSQKETDITDPKKLRDTVESVAPDVIINCAAFTDVDACENINIYYSVVNFNMQGIRNLVGVFSGPVIHISTDYVFGGHDGPYDEKSKYASTGPVNNYGWAKMGSEIAFLAYDRPQNLLVRTTGLYGRNHHYDFFKLVVNTLRDGKELKVSSNLRGNQTYIPHLAEALIHIVHNPDRFHGTRILNVASEEILSRYEFALMIATVFELDKSLIVPRTNNQIDGWVANRPTKAGLKVKLAQKMGVPIYRILDGLEALRGEDRSARPSNQI